jgi:hypothetical protein
MYTPLNTPVYLRAFAGFLSGITAAAKTDVNAGDYTLYAEMADAWAQQVDTSWGVSAPTLLELDGIDGGSEAVWENSSPPPSKAAVLAGTYLTTALAVIARVRQGNAQVVSEGIDPNGTGSPGTGTVTSVTGTLPIVITGGATVTPNVTIVPATDIATGSLSAADKTKLDALAPGAAGGTSTILVANAAALTAVPAAALANDQPAAVATFGAAFALQPAGPAVDNATVIAASDGRVWLRGATLIAPAARTQLAWSVDPQNSTGTASDENPGTTLLPLLTKAEIVRRWGGTSVTLDGVNVTITMLSPDTIGAGGGHDPGIFRPTFTNGATLLITAVLPAPSFTGTLLAVTPKNKASAATCTPLRSTFTVTTGAVAPAMLLVNATRGNSRAFAQRNTGGGLWQISQPFAPNTTLATPANTEVDTWANGDAITGYLLPNVDLVMVGGITSEQAAGPSFIVRGLNFVDPSSNANDLNDANFDSTAKFSIQECSFSRSISCAGQGGLPASSFNNCSSPAAGTSGTVYIYGPVGWLGGILGSFATLYDGNTYFGPGSDCIITNGGASIFKNTFWTSVCIDTSASPTCVGQSFMTGGQPIYTVNGSGGSTALVSEGVIRYTAPAVNNLQVPLAITGAAGSNAYSNLTTAGVVTTHALALTPANLDAAAGAAGFGGLAYVPGVGSFTVGNVAP